MPLDLDTGVDSSSLATGLQSGDRSSILWTRGDSLLFFDRCLHLKGFLIFFEGKALFDYAFQLLPFVPKRRPRG